MGVRPGREGGREEAGGDREREREETGMVWQMCIQIYHASSGSEGFWERKWRVKHIE